jgi:hypothetical protein
MAKLRPWRTPAAACQASAVMRSSSRHHAKEKPACGVGEPAVEQSAVRHLPRQRRARTNQRCFAREHAP